MLRFFGQKGRFLRKGGQASDQIEQSSCDLSCGKSAADSAMGFVSVTIQILCDILVILLVLQGKVRMATLVGASNLIACVTNGLHEFANLRMSLAAGRPYFEKLTAERQETGPVRSLPPLHDAIRMEGIS